MTEESQHLLSVDLNLIRYKPMTLQKHAQLRKTSLVVVVIP